MEKKTYSEKLKDPRWQKKRLEIFERDEWTCQRCNHTEYPLAVHHLRYIQGLDPWEYESKILITLCEYCHETEYKEMPEALEGLVQVLKDQKYFAFDVKELSDLLAQLDREDRQVVLGVIKPFLKDDEFRTKITSLVEIEWGKQSDEFMAKIKSGEA
jgi:hypothetical protein